MQKRGIGLAEISFLSCLFLASPALAQLVPDDTLGSESSVVTPGAIVDGLPANLIEGGAERGSNLFHSFIDFNVLDTQQVYFANPTGILNIFSRVTGSDPSNIFGTLGVDGYANLFLINPNGIAFGPNARLDIPASFTASTADSITFDDGQFFSAVNPNTPPILQINITPGLQYGPQQTEITNQGILETGQNLTLGAYRLNLAGDIEAGRDIILQGQERFLSAADYTVGGYLFTQDLTGAGIDFLIPHENVIIAEGDVIFKEDYVGPSLYVLAGGRVSQSETTINLEINEATDGRVTETITNGIEDSQVITVEAIEGPTIDIRTGIDTSLLTGAYNTSMASVEIAEMTNSELILNDVTNYGGDIRLISSGGISTGRLYTSVEKSYLPFELTQRADGGDVYLAASDNIEVDGIHTQATTEAVVGANIMGGNGGNIFIFADNVRTSNDAFSTQSVTNTVAGNVFGGNGGNLLISASGNAFIGYSSGIDFGSYSSSFELGDVVGGDGGSATIIAKEDLVLNAVPVYSSSSSRSSGNVIGGNGGEIILRANNIEAYSLFSYSEIWTDTTDEVISGNGGNVDIATKNNANIFGIVSTISLTNAFSDSGQSNQTITGGDGGDITVTAENDIISGYTYYGSGFSTYSLTSSEYGTIRGGNGGNISLLAGRDISAGEFAQDHASLLTFSAAQSDSDMNLGGDAGNISITARFGEISLQSLYGRSEFDLTPYELYAFSITENGDAGDGGNINLTASESIKNADILTLSSSGLSGQLTVLGEGNIILENISVATSKQVEVAMPNFSESVIIPVGGEGESGNISISSKQNLTFINSLFLSDTNGTESAGDVRVDSPGLIIFSNTEFNSDTQDFGQAGSFAITAGEGIQLIGAETQLLAQASATGNAGNIILDSPEVVIRDEATVSTSTNGSGLAGDIVINSDILEVSNGGEILAFTAGTGNGGSITVNANQTVDLGEGVQDFEPIISVEASGAGRPGRDDPLPVEKAN